MGQPYGCSLTWHLVVLKLRILLLKKDLSQLVSRSNFTHTRHQSQWYGHGITVPVSNFPQRVAASTARSEVGKVHTYRTKKIGLCKSYKLR